MRIVSAWICILIIARATRVPIEEERVTIKRGNQEMDGDRDYQEIYRPRLAPNLKRNTPELIMAETKRTRADDGFTPQILLLQALIFDPKKPIDQIGAEIETLGIEISSKDLHNLYEKYMQLTWVPEWQHVALVAAFGSDTRAANRARTRLDRYLQSASYHERTRLDLWIQYCIAPLMRGAETPCEPEPSEWLGSENIQWTMSPVNIRRLFEHQLEQVNAPRRHVPKRDRDDQDGGYRKQGRPSCTDEVKRFVFECLAIDPNGTTEMIAATLLDHGILVEPSSIDAVISEAGLDISVPDWLHQLLLSIPDGLDSDSIRMLVTLTIFENPAASEEEIQREAAKAPRWIKWCIEPMRESAEAGNCITNPANPAEWILSDERKAQIYSSLIEIV